MVLKDRIKIYNSDLSEEINDFKFDSTICTDDYKQTTITEYTILIIF